MATPFETFVNVELPKRPFTQADPSSWEAGKALRTTGVGLGVEAADFPVDTSVVGTWDMSQVPVGANAVLQTDFQATHTTTRITPSPSMTSSGTYRVSAVETLPLSLTGTGTATSHLFMPAWTAGNTIHLFFFILCNSDATSQDIEDVFNGITPANPVWFCGSLLNSKPGTFPAPATPTFRGITCSNSVLSYGASSPTTSGATVSQVYDYSSKILTTETVVQTVLDTSAISALGQNMKLIVGMLSEADTTVFTPGYLSYNLGVSGEYFHLVSETQPPAGASSGMWYQVTGAGTFSGKSTQVNDYVKLINSLTDIVVVRIPSTLYPSYSWASKPSPASVPAGTRIRITDVGPNPSDWENTGTYWIKMQPVKLLELSGGVPYTPSLDPTVLATISVPGGTMGPYGWLRITGFISMTPSVHNKIISVGDGVTTIASSDIQDAAAQGITLHSVFRNNGGSIVEQKSPNTVLQGISYSGITTTTKDTEADFQLYVYGQASHLDDTISVEYLSVEIL